MESGNDIDFTVRFDGVSLGTVYLSVSWQPDAGKGFGYKVIRKMDEENYLAIGDVKGFAAMDADRLRRIMRQADAFMSILPYRPDKACRTSGFMLDELELAIEVGLPIGILYDARIAPNAVYEPGQSSAVLMLPDGRQVSIPRERLAMLSPFDFGVRESEELRLAELSSFLERAVSSQSALRPYAFLISRLQPDFRLPREACLAAAERGSGIPCYWIDSMGYQSNIDDTIERARLLIKHSAFVVAEMSLTEENPEFDNPSRAHEIGLAAAYGKTLFLVAHGPRRPPYHGLVSRQLLWWDSEEDLFAKLRDAVHTERGTIGRHVYNWELERVDSSAVPNFQPPEFEPNGDRWHPPLDAEENRVQSWIYAASFSVIAFSVAFLLRHGVGYDDTLDLAALLTGVVTFMFSSRISKSIHSALARIRYLKWLIPAIAALLLAATLAFLRPSGQVDQKGPDQTGQVQGYQEEEAGQQPSARDR